MSQEQAQTINTEKKYTESDMFAAFRHGRNYEQFKSDGDVVTESLPEKNRPFWEWLRLLKQPTTRKVIPIKKGM